MEGMANELMYKMRFYELRLYQTTDLITASSATIKSELNPKTKMWNSLSNLVGKASLGNTRRAELPYTDNVKTQGVDQCFSFNTRTLERSAGKMIFTVTLTNSDAFVHTVLLV